MGQGLARRKSSELAGEAPPPRRTAHEVVKPMGGTLQVRTLPALPGPDRLLSIVTVMGTAR